ncbi:hypothetical protein B0T17DRAFT_615080 [Bombardia bombarda]|uniref:Uncharacterized protein n=1 Tax=Bombardia bombarda TaxID=252184 RepID=A0AA40C975_9PEZI|nr:hypothetical protein B0T17DRAFT_615080 [Bombardia bombarda]
MDLKAPSLARILVIFELIKELHAYKRDGKTSQEELKKLCIVSAYVYVGHVWPLLVDSKVREALFRILASLDGGDTTGSGIEEEEEAGEPAVENGLEKCWCPDGFHSSKNMRKTAQHKIQEDEIEQTHFF